jgi:hypothetical protein
VLIEEHARRCRRGERRRHGQTLRAGDLATLS